jgi:hypothetical protein
MSAMTRILPLSSPLVWCTIRGGHGSTQIGACPFGPEFENAVAQRVNCDLQGAAVEAPSKAESPLRMEVLSTRFPVASAPSIATPPPVLPTIKFRLMILLGV